MKLAFLAAALVTGAGAMHVERQMRETVRAAFAVPGLINNEGLVMDAGANNGQVRPHCHYHQGPFTLQHRRRRRRRHPASFQLPWCLVELLPYTPWTPHQPALPL